MSQQPDAAPPSTVASGTPLVTGFLESIVRFLMPYFIGTAAGVDAARAEILETLAACGARTRMEMLSAAQIIAFSMSTLDMLAEAKAAELSASLRLRCRGCANGLSRSTRQHEASLDRSLAAEPQATGPLMAGDPLSDPPLDNLSDQAVQIAIQQAQATLAGHRAMTPATAATPAATPLAATPPVATPPVATPLAATPHPASRPAATQPHPVAEPSAPLSAPAASRPLTPQERNKQLWAGAMLETLRQMGFTGESFTAA